MTNFMQGDRAYVRNRKNEYYGHAGFVTRTAPASVGGSLVFVSFDGWKEVSFYENDLLKAGLK